MKNFKNNLRKLPLKIISCLLLLIAVCASVYLCSGKPDPVVSSLTAYTSRTYGENGGIFKNKLKYGEYYYEKILASVVDKSEYLSEVDYEAYETLKRCTADFEKRIEQSLASRNSKDRELALKYKFTATQIEEGDYYRCTLKESKDGELEYYDIYYFDFSEKKLYFLYFDKSTLK